MGELRDFFNSLNLFKKIPVLRIKGLYGKYDVNLPLDGKLKVLYTGHNLKSTTLRLLYGMILDKDVKILFKCSIVKNITLSNRSSLKGYHCILLDIKRCNEFFQNESWIDYEEKDLSVLGEFVESIQVGTKLQAFAYYNHYMTVDRLDVKLAQNKYPLEVLSDSEKWLFYLYYTIGYMYRNEKLIVLIDNPEMFLHVAIQRSLLSDLLKFTNVKYLLAFTQSPEIMADADGYEYSTSGMLNYKVLKGE